MKISIARNQRKKTKRNLTHEVSTTSDFGFCQPILCREMVAQDSFRMRLGQIVRLQPMPLPTFGSIQVKNYTAFVPFADIFHPYESLLSGQTYSGSASRYIPVSVPKIRLSTLAHILCMFSTCISKNYSNRYTQFGNVDYTFSPICRSAQQVISDVVTWFQNSTMLDSSTANISLFQSIESTYGRPYKAVLCDGTAEQMQGFDFYADVPGQSNGVLIGFKYNRWAKNLRKIFIGCGYQIDGFSQVEVSILPLIAYYKVWFDYFQPARDKTWKDTAAFALMEFLEQTGTVSIDDYLTDDNSPGLANKIIPYFVEFLHDLCQCYHVANHDYASSHITGVAGTLVPQNSRDSFTPSGNSAIGYVGNSSGNQASLDASIQLSSTRSISAQSLDILKKLTQRVSIHTAIGGRIKEFLRAVYNSDYVDVHDSYQLGTSQFDVQIDPVFATNQSSDVNLGEFAGRALGADDGNKSIITYTTKVPGILITISALVPVAKMAQGIDPNLLHLKKEDFYDPTFDGSTLVPTKQICIYGMNNCDNAYFSHTGSFGNIPIYTEYKVAQNKINGDMSLPSSMASYLPFTLDKLLPMPDSSVIKEDDDEILRIYGVPSTLLAAGSIWRFTNLYPWLGNYNRIFINSGETHQYSADWQSTWSSYGFIDDIDDNFVLHNHIELQVVGMPESFADSWYTGAGSDSDMNITQS